MQVPANAKRCANSGLMLAHRLRHCVDIKPTWFTILCSFMRLTERIYKSNPVNVLFRCNLMGMWRFNPITAGAAYIRVFIFLLAH